MALSKLLNQRAPLVLGLVLSTLNPFQLALTQTDPTAQAKSPIQPSSSTAFFLEALQAATEEKWVEALSIWEECLQDSPESALLKYCTALAIEHSGGSASDALLLYVSAFEHCQSDYLAGCIAHNHGLLFLNRGKLDYGTKSMRLAGSKLPQSAVDGLLVAAHYYERKNQWKDASELYSQALEKWDGHNSQIIGNKSLFEGQDAIEFLRISALERLPRVQIQLTNTTVVKGFVIGGIFNRIDYGKSPSDKVILVNVEGQDTIEIEKKRIRFFKNLPAESRQPPRYQISKHEIVLSAVPKGLPSRTELRKITDQLLNANAADNALEVGEIAIHLEADDKSLAWWARVLSTANRTDEAASIQAYLSRSQPSPASSIPDPSHVKAPTPRTIPVPKDETSKPTLGIEPTKRLATLDSTQSTDAMEQTAIYTPTSASNPPSKAIDHLQSHNKNQKPTHNAQPFLDPTWLSQYLPRIAVGIAIMALLAAVFYTPRLLTEIAIFRAAKTDYHRARGTHHLRQIMSALRNLDERLATAKAERNLVETMMASLQQEMKQRLLRAPHDYLIENELPTLPGIGPILTQRIVASCYRGNISGLSRVGSVPGIGPEKAYTVLSWLKDAKTRIPRMFEDSFPGKRAIEESFEQQRDSLEKKRIALNCQIRLLERDRAPAAAECERLKNVKPRHFRKCHRGHRELDKTVSEYMNGSFPEWMETPSWFRDLLREYGE